MAYDFLIMSCVILGGLFICSGCDGFSKGDKFRFWVLTIFGSFLLLLALPMLVIRVGMTFAH